MIVDVHCHFVPRSRVEGLPGFRAAPGLDSRDQLFYGERYLGHLVPRLTEPSILLEDMDRFGIDVRAVATGSWLFCYWADPDLGERFARTMNDGFAELARAHPRRIILICQRNLHALSSG